MDRRSLAARMSLAIVVTGAGLLAVSLHRHGHTQGDDFALYLRQARSIFDGDPAAVIADNRFSVINSDTGFSPIGYPWGWPLLLSPFVRLWGLDYDRLKLLEVALLCFWLTMLHGIVRRRLGRICALAVTAVFATCVAYLKHTEQLLTEIPHLAAVVVVVWWFDRIRGRATLLTAPIGDLAILGVLAALAFNVRREGVALILAVMVVQFVELVRARRDDEPEGRDLDDVLRHRTRQLATPLVSFVGAVVVCQLLLPTALFPDNGNSWSNIDDRFGEYPSILSEQLGFGVHPAVGVAVFVLAVAGAIIGVRARPHLDGLLLLIAVFSALTIGTHFRQVDRYWFQVNPWVVYFATVALVAAARVVLQHRATAIRVVAVAPLVGLVVAHLVVMPGHLAEVREFNEDGRVLSGPTNPESAPVYDAVNDLTPPDAVIGFFRARTMTLLTDRRSFQTKQIDRVALGADYIVLRDRDTAWQPQVEEVVAAGFVQIWADDTWTLWKAPPERTGELLSDETDEGDDSP